MNAEMIEMMDLLIAVITLIASAIIIPWTIFVTRTLFTQSKQIAIMNEHLALIRQEISLLREVRDFVKMSMTQ